MRTIRKFAITCIRLVALLILIISNNNLFGQVPITISYPGSQYYILNNPITPLNPNAISGFADILGYTSQPLAGNGAAASIDGTGTSAYFNNPLNTAVDAHGNVYVADAGNHKIRRITPLGDVTTLAGTGSAGYLDGPGYTARFQHPAGLAVDAAGNVYVSDHQNHRIRKIDLYGNVSTFAGSGAVGSVDGQGTSASFQYPFGLAFDAAGNLYVCDSWNNKIRRIDPSGMVTTFAGTGVQGSINGNRLLNATFNKPSGIAIDENNNIFICDRYNHTIRRIASSGTVSTFAGTGYQGSADNVGSLASFNYPANLAVNSAGEVYVADQSNSTIRKISPTGRVTTIAGVAGSSSIVNGTGSIVRYTSTYGLSMDKQGSIYVAQNASNMIRKLVTQPYIIYPPLPPGLNFDNLWGQITGTPTVGQSQRTYYLQAFNKTHSSNVATMNISVASSAPGISGSTDQNFVATYTPLEPFTDVNTMQNASIDKARVQTTIEYYDGIGRPIQMVQAKGNGSGTKDLIQSFAYDQYGRQSTNYLPYSTSNSSIASYRSDALSGTSGYSNSAQKTFYSTTGQGYATTSYPLSQTVYEASPMNRIAEQGAVDDIWQPAGSRTATTGRTQIVEYKVNNASTAYTTTGFRVRLYRANSVNTVGQEHKRTLSGTGYYPANTLALTIKKDENWVSADGKAGTSEEYKDNQGRMILKRIFNKEGSTIQVASTYYVYDEFGRLSFVLPPGANADAVSLPTQTVLDNYCYQYRYDGRGRLMESRTPGKGWEQIIYTTYDQIIFTQDSMQRVATAPGPYRSFLKYDGLGRVIMSGVESGHTGTHSSVQDVLNTWPWNVWEDRDFSGTHGYTNIGCPGNLTNMDIQVVNYYDDYNIPGIPNNQSAGYSKLTHGLLTATKVKILGTSNYLWTVNYYDDRRQLLKVWKQHSLAGVVNASNYDEVINTYNFSGQVASTTRNHYVSGSPKFYQYTEYVYDHMGRLVDTKQKTGDDSGTGNPVILASRNSYNEIGQLVSKGLHSVNLASPSFAQNITYSYNARGWLTGKSSDLFNQSLNYQEIVDGLTPQYNGNISRQQWGPSSNPVLHNYVYTYDKINRLLSAKSDEGHNELLGYDLMGNITRLQRKNFNATIDQLKYTYSGNRLTNVTDTNTNTSSSFQLPGSTDYATNGNGNMVYRISVTSAGNNMYDMAYNHLDLPTNINANGAVITYTYSANGEKLKKLITGSFSVSNEYISGIHYEGGALQFVNTADGRVRRTGANAYKYEYTLTDHLGNGRVYFEINGSNAAAKVQEVDYYPFGKQIDRLVPYPKNLYMFGGKEHQKDHEKMYDFGARFYDPVIGRWHVVDPLADQMRRQSPYNYAFNNPVRFTDPDGMMPVDPPWYQKILDWLKPGRKKPVEDPEEQAELEDNRRRMMAANEDFGEGYENLKENMGYVVPFSTTAFGLMEGSSKRDNTVVAGALLSGAEELLGGKIVGKAVAKGGPALKKIIGEAGKKLAENVAKNGETAATALGRKMHNLYKVGEEGIKEFRLLSGKRIDFLDSKSGVIYELKPNNPRAIKAGRNQLDMYLKELQSPEMLEKYPDFKGITWKTVLDTY